MKHYEAIKIVYEVIFCGNVSDNEDEGMGQVIEVIKLLS